MICDHIGCKIEPRRAPRLIVPSKTWTEPDHHPLKMMTTLHYCELHKGELKVAHLLTGKVKADFEAIAKKKRPIDFKCDFDAAFIEFVLVTTPEYRDFMIRLGRWNILKLAAGG